MGKAFVTVKNKKSVSSVIKILVPVLLFVVIAIVVIVGVQDVSKTTQQERLRTMEQAVRRSVVQCYAIEGRYPEDLEYLRENYGLSLDEDKYVYHYRLVGSNLLPEIKVFES